MRSRSRYSCPDGARILNYAELFTLGTYTRIRAKFGTVNSLIFARRIVTNLRTNIVLHHIIEAGARIMRLQIFTVILRD